MVAPDAQLLMRAWNGDRTAFGQLAEGVYRSVYGYALSRVRDRDLAEDVTQEVFLRAWKSIQDIRDPGAFLSWLFATTRNVIQEEWRKRKRFEKSMKTEEPIQLRKEQSQLLEGFDELPDEMKIILSLKYSEGLTCAEISKRLGRPLGTVTSLLSRAYHDLRSRLT